MKLRRMNGPQHADLADPRVGSECKAAARIGRVFLLFVRDAPGSGLKRHHLIESPWFSISVNRLTTPVNPGPPHDHVRSFVSIPLVNGYLERRTDAITGLETDHWRRPFVPYWQHRDQFHINAGAPKGPCWTLTFYGPTHKALFNFRMRSGRIVNLIEWGEMVARGPREKVTA